MRACLEDDKSAPERESERASWAFNFNCFNTHLAPLPPFSFYLTPLQMLINYVSRRYKGSRARARSLCVRINIINSPARSLCRVIVVGNTIFSDRLRTRTFY